jgi:anti-anti-sigma factor
MPSHFGPAPLTVEAVDVSHVILVRVCGQLDAITAHQLALTLFPLETRHVDLDLVHVASMDPVALALLLTHRYRSIAAGGGLRLVDFSPAVAEVLVLTATALAQLTAPGPKHP